MLLLAGHDPAAMSTGDQTAGIGEFRQPIDLEVGAELVMHRLKCFSVNQRPERAGMPDALIPDLADVAAIVQEAMERGFRPFGLPVGVDDALMGERVDERFKRQRLIGEQLKDALDLRRLNRIMLRRCCGR